MAQSPKKNKSRKKEPYVNEQGFFHASRDNTRIFFQRWLPEKRSRLRIQKAKSLKEYDRRGKSKDEVGRVLVIQHGFGEHSSRYGNLVQHLEETNISIYALDARGHGRSDGKRGHVDQFQYYIDDLSDLIQIAKREQRMDKIYLFGHSLGGVIASQYALQYENQHGLEGLLLSSPAFRVHMNPSQKVKKYLAYTMAALAPSVTIKADLDVRYISHDPNVIEDYHKDPWVHGEISFQMGKNLFFLGKVLIHKARNLVIPSLVMTGSGDRIIDPQGAKDFYNGIVARDKKYHSYEGLYHELINETEQERQKVLNDIHTWIQAH